MTRTIAYRIVHISTEQFAIFSENFTIGKQVQINTNCGYNLRSDWSQLINIIKVQFLQDDKLLMVIELTCYYDIEPEEVSAIKQEAKIPVDVLKYVGSISIGITRGVIHTKTEGTVLNPVVLPPVNLDELVKKDLNIPIRSSNSLSKN